MVNPGCRQIQTTWKNITSILPHSSGGIHFCSLVCLSTYWKERHKPVYINDAKDGLVMKREDSSFNNSDEVEELSAFSFSDSSALPGQ